MKRRRWTAAERDLCWIGLASVALFAVAGWYDAFDVFVHWYAKQPEPYGLEEILPVVLILPFALALFAWRRWQELRHARRELHELKGILPICSYCKKIRDDEGYWHQVEEYIRHHSEANFSHGLCPECYEKALSDLGEQR
ncbi:MAG TPA: hypothetical protein VN436_10535 [Holophaga sp.]|nr:hypothetical protein [Holophaga sp.]